MTRIHWILLHSLIASMLFVSLVFGLRLEIIGGIVVSSIGLGNSLTMVGVNLFLLWMESDKETRK